MNVPAEAVRALMRNQAFPLSVQTAFVEDLRRASGVPGTIDIVALASTADSEDQARFSLIPWIGWPTITRAACL